VGLLEGLSDLDDLAARVVRSEVDRRADPGRAQLERALHRAEHDLVVLVRERQQLVVVELDDERDLVRVLAGHRAQHAEGRRDGVGAALDRQADEVLGVEVHRVRREARARRVLDALVDGQDRHVARPAEPAVVEQPLQVAQRAVVAVGQRIDAIDEVRAGQMKLVGGDGLRAVLKQTLGVIPE
jgi:hypothetical protein